jgi:hypothetical protein
MFTYHNISLKKYLFHSNKKSASCALDASFHYFYLILSKLWQKLSSIKFYIKEIKWLLALNSILIMKCLEMNFYDIKYKTMKYISYMDREDDILLFSTKILVKTFTTVT